jgi:hypothetical protein
VIKDGPVTRCDRFIPFISVTPTRISGREQHEDQSGGYHTQKCRRTSCTRHHTLRRNGTTTRLRTRTPKRENPQTYRWKSTTKMHRHRRCARRPSTYTLPSLPPLFFFLSTSRHDKSTLIKVNSCYTVMYTIFLFFSFLHPPLLTFPSMFHPTPILLETRSPLLGRVRGRMQRRAPRGHIRPALTHYLRIFVLTSTHCYRRI